MAFTTQLSVTLHTIRKNPGKDIDELYEIIKGKYSGNWRVDFMIHGDDTTQLRERISDLNCIEEKDGRFYFNPDKKPYYKGIDIIGALLEYSVKQAIEMEKKDYKEQITDGENKF